MPSKDFGGMFTSTRKCETLSPQGNIFRVSFTLGNIFSGLKTEYFWFPVAVVLHACPAFDKLADKGEIRGDQHENRKTHLKKVVDPPEPYSRTFIPGFRTEHINSTPPLSSITVLDFKIKIMSGGGL